MVIVDDKKEELPSAEQPDGTDSIPVAGPSTAAPPATTLPSPPLPTFQEATETTALIRHDFSDSDVFVPPGGEEPPPDFTPYEAEFFETSDGNIVSHDPHLNEDGASHPTNPVISTHIHVSRRRSVVSLPAGWVTDPPKVPVAPAWRPCRAAGVGRPARRG